MNSVLRQPAQRGIARRKPPAEAAGAQAFKRLAPFAELPGELICLVQEQLKSVSFKAGELILRQGEAGSSLLAIWKGKVEISTRDDAGRHFIGRAGAGDVLGEMSLLSGEPRSADATAVTDVRAWLLSADKFHRLARAHPQLAVVLTRLVAARLGGPGRDVLAGKSLGGYQIARRLGRGGMGVVYEAVESATGRRVALKMMSHRLVYDAAALAQFERESWLIERFEHPNLVAVYGRFAAFHTYFIAMQFCDGEPLSAIIQREGPLAEDECRKIIGQLTQGLSYAHAAGVIHRDVKPANVLVDRAGIVHLTDFGLARPIVDHDANLESLVVGTPRYMAPEQMFGEGVDHRADLFSLGCVAYELVTSRPLFDAGGASELLRRAIEWRPRAEVLALGRRVTAPVQRFLRQCLEPNPRRRRPDLATAASWAAPVDAELLRVGCLP